MTDWQAPLNLEIVDGVVIATPNTLHFPAAKGTPEAGRHVLVEYPHTTTNRDGAELLNIL